MSTIDSRGTATPLPEVDLVLATALALFEGFIAQRLLPAFESLKRHGTLPFNVHDRRIYTAARAPDGSFQRILTEVGAKEFLCGEYGLESVLFDSDIPVYGTRERGQQHKASQTALSLLTTREAAAAALLFSTDTFSGSSRLVSIAGGKEWGAAATEVPNASAVPLTDFGKAIGLLEDRGFRRDQLSIVLPVKTNRILSTTSQMITQVRAMPAYANLGANAIPAIIPGSVLASLLGVKEVIVAGSVKDTSNRAKASVIAPLWDPEKVLVAYLSQSDYDDAGLGRTIVSSEGLDRSALSAAADLPTDPGLIFHTDSYREEKVTGDVIRVREQSIQKVLNADAGVLIDNCLS